MNRPVSNALADRGDLPIWITHLTRSSQSPKLATALDNLKSIIKDRQIEARTVHGAYTLAQQALVNQTPLKSVCFMEVPVKDLRFVVDLKRGCNLERYGISIPRTKARETGVQPVWYIDQSYSRQWLTAPPQGNNPSSAGALWELIDEARTNTRLQPVINQLLPYFDINNPSTYEYWWAREWRHVGHYRLDQIGSGQLVVWCPENEHEGLRRWLHDLEDSLDKT